MKITAKGKIRKTDLEVTAESNAKGKVQFRFNGKKNRVSEDFVKDLLKECHNFGNYIPEVYEDLNIYNVLENYFPFDEKPDMTADGMKTLPWEKGVIY